ncbi:MAG: prephenate dehydrogenase/arogenate dehydrogenase family protein, partial [Campylobacter sp.]|nr:prephenate dehydrogenase/arogenate dehydrogenase family protein [Campylobacter sp.]
QMWSDIFKQNKDNLLEAITSFKNELEICENMIKNEKWDELKEWMETARALREIL